MHLVRVSDNEMLVTDGHRTIRFMARGDLGALNRGEINLELESANFNDFLDKLCKGCDRFTQDKPRYVGRVCFGCSSSSDNFEEVR